MNIHEMKDTTCLKCVSNINNSIVTSSVIIILAFRIRVLPQILIRMYSFDTFSLKMKKI